MAVLNQVSDFNHLRELLHSLYDADYYDYAYDWDKYPVIKSELVNKLSHDVNVAVHFINSLDFNDNADAHIIKFFPTIMENLGSFTNQLVFMDCINSIRKTYPNVNFGDILFDMTLTLGANLKNNQ